MRKLRNTLYILSCDASLTLKEETVLVSLSHGTSQRIPLHTIEEIISFSQAPVTPALLGACACRGIAMSFFSVNGRFLAALRGSRKGNANLRKRQALLDADASVRLILAKRFIEAKIINALAVLYGRRTVQEIMNQRLAFAMQ